MRIGVLDSGFGGGAALRRRFWWGPSGLETEGTTRPLAAHGASIAALIREAARVPVELLDAQIFGRALRCPPEVAAAGLDWLVAQDAAVVNLSWGLASDSAVLERACARARAAGVWLVAATPIRGAAPAPARYTGVIRATGDARCADGEISYFGGTPADYGASPGPESGAAPEPPTRGGSSFACARVCGALVRVLSSDSRGDPRIALRREAAHRGPQTRPVSSA